MLRSRELRSWIYDCVPLYASALCDPDNMGSGLGAIRTVRMICFRLTVAFVVRRALCPLTTEGEESTD